MKTKTLIKIVNKKNINLKNHKVVEGNYFKDLPENPNILETNFGTITFFKKQNKFYIKNCYWLSNGVNYSCFCDFFCFERN